MTWLINPYQFGYSGTLLNNLISWWPMDETSGTRVDSHGANDLTDNNTVTYAAGKVGNSALFTEANSEYLTLSSPPQPNALSLSFWFRYTGAAVDFLFDIANGVDIYINAGNMYNRLHAGVAPVITGVSVDTWYHYVYTHNTSANTHTHYVNTSPVVLTGNNLALTSTLWIFGWRTSLAAGHSLNGQLDEFAAWDREIISGEVSELYNSGAGIGYPG